MFKNYFKIAWRSLAKNKLTSFINVLGLSIGISSALIIGLIIQYDFSFDKYEPGKENIYRITSENETWKTCGVPAPLHTALANNIPGIETTVPLFGYNDWNTKVIIPQGNNKAAKIFKKQQNIVFTNNNYFSVFPHQWIAGNPSASLKNPHAVVLSESVAKLYFPNIPAGDVIGRTVFFSDTVMTTVTGVVKDLNSSSDFEFKTFISLPTIPAAGLAKTYSWDRWNSINSATQVIVKLFPGANFKQVSKQIQQVFKNNDSDPDDAKTKHLLQPLSDVHFNKDLEGKVDKSTVIDLVFLSIFLLLLGAINFINLSTAQAVRRAKEIGIRKTLGSRKRQLILQFLAETFLLTACTAILSVIISPLLMKVFSGFIPEGLTFDYFFNQPFMWVFLVLMIVIVSILAGIYPAFILARFKPVLVLKNQASSAPGTTRTALLRKTLIVFQFIIAQAFIIGMMVVDKQIHYSMQKDMGFREDAIINFYVPFDFYHPDNKKYVLRDELRNIPEIQEVSLGNQSPAFNGQMSTEIAYTENGKEIKMDVDSRNGDTSFLSLYHIKLIAGRNLMPTDTATELLVNETLAKQLGFVQPANAVGHFVKFGSTMMPIVGVMADFNLASVRTAIHPMIYYSDLKYGYVMHVALQQDPATWKTAIAKMTTAWKKNYPDSDFDYSFLDNTISDFYKQDKQLSLLLTWSAGVAIFISCLGLLGLVIFMINHRTKEIGVRKVLGASVVQIITLLSGDFAKLLAVAFAVAIPVAWWIMHDWLQNFAYHTVLSWWVFMLSGIVMMTIALTILAIRAGKAAMANPAISLRTE